MILEIVVANDGSLPRAQQVDHADQPPLQLGHFVVAGGDAAPTPAVLSTMPVPSGNWQMARPMPTSAR
jgi:hypothetical protein